MCREDTSPCFLPILSLFRAIPFPPHLLCLYLQHKPKYNNVSNEEISAGDIPVGMYGCGNGKARACCVA